MCNIYGITFDDPNESLAFLEVISRVIVNVEIMAFSSQMTHKKILFYSTYIHIHWYCKGRGNVRPMGYENRHNPRRGSTIYLTILFWLHARTPCIASLPSFLPFPFMMSSRLLDAFLVAFVALSSTFLKFHNQKSSDVHGLGSNNEVHVRLFN
jgi:hypothetical protein